MQNMKNKHCKNVTKTLLFFIVVLAFYICMAKYLSIANFEWLETRKFEKIHVIYEKIVLNLYDMTKPISNETEIAECVNVKRAEPPYWACLHDNDYVSDYVRQYVEWEPIIQRLIKNFFNKFSDITFVDLGANIGLHSLYIASMNSNVDILAVEPFPKNAHRIHKAALLNGVQNQITLVLTALSDRRENVVFKEKIGSIGENTILNKVNNDTKYFYVNGVKTQTLLIDDLRSLVKKPNIFLKIDIEGMECKAFSQARKFFSSFNILYVVMEFQHTRVHGNCCIESMLELFEEFNFIPFSPDVERLSNQTMLNYTEWQKWTYHDLLFVQKKLLNQ